MKIFPEVKKRSPWHKWSSIYSPISGSGSYKPVVHGPVLLENHCSPCPQCVRLPAALFVTQLVLWVELNPTGLLLQIGRPTCALDWTASWLPLSTDLPRSTLLLGSRGSACSVIGLGLAFALLGAGACTLG